VGSRVEEALQGSDGARVCDVEGVLCPKDEGTLVGIPYPW